MAAAQHGYFVAWSLRGMALTPEAQAQAFAQSTFIFYGRFPFCECVSIYYVLSTLY